MPGLLSTGNSSGGLLTGLLAPQGNLGATAEAMRRQREREAAMRAQQQAEAQAAAARAAPPQRGRVNPLRVFDGIFSSEGDGTFSGSLDRERRRLEAEAMRPQAMARMEQMRAAAARMGPEAMIAFETNPEAFGESLGMQYRPVTTAAGSITSYGPGEGARRVAAPVVDRFDDRHGVLDPLNPQAGTQYTTPRAATFAEETDRYRVENPVLAANSIWVGPDGQPRAQGYVAPEVSSIPQGGSVVVTRDGRPETVVQGNPDTPPAGRNGAANFDATTRGALQSARSAAQQAAARAADARRFIALNEANSTGLGAAVLGPLAGLNPAYAEMRAISARLVPGERTPGSGPMSDKDVALYTRAVLDVDKPGPTNQSLANVVIAQAERDAEYAAFLDEYATRNGNLNGAQEDWTAYVNANPLFAAGADGMTRVLPRVTDWRTFMGYGGRQRGGGGGAAASPDLRAAALAEARRRGLIP